MLLRTHFPILAITEAASRYVSFVASPDTLSNNTVTEAIPIGRCTADRDQKICTSVPDGCSIQSKFEEYHPHCTLLGNEQIDFNSDYALYPACRKDKMGSESFKTCVWNKECKEEGMFWNAILAYGIGYDGPCTCDRVKVGACFHQESRQYFCAVSEDICEEGDTFMTYRQLEAKNGPGICCRLCRPVVQDKKTQEVAISTTGMSSTNTFTESLLLWH